MAALRVVAATVEVAVLTVALDHGAAAVRAGPSPFDLHDDAAGSRDQGFQKIELVAEEGFEVVLPEAHLIESFFPNSRFIRIEHFVGQGVDEKISVVRRLEVFLFPFGRQKFALNQFLNDRRPRRFRTDALDFFQLLLQAVVFDVLINLLHGRQ